MKRKFDHIAIGTLAGLVVPLISFFLIYIYKFETIDFKLFLEYIYNKNIVPEFISLSGIPNLALFFYFLRKNMYQSARGVILATFLLAGAVIILKVA